MLDDILNFLHGIPGPGTRALLHILFCAVVFPLLAILVGLNTTWSLWVLLYGGLCIASAAGVLIFILWSTWTDEQRPWVRSIGIAVVIVLVLGAFPGANTIAMILGLAVAFGAIVALGIGFSGAVLIYKLVLAIAPGPLVTDAEPAARRTLKAFISLAAWEWVVGGYLFALGPEFTWTLGLLLFFTTVIMALGTIGWGFSAEAGKAIAFYVSELLFFIVSGILVLSVADRYDFWDTPAWAVMQPFAVALIPIGVWAGLLWLGRGRFVRAIASIAMTFMVMRALLLLVPVHSWGDFAGRNIRPWLLPPADAALRVGTGGAYQQILRQEEKLLKKELTAITDEMKKIKNPTLNQIKDWKERIAKTEMEFPDLQVQHPPKPLLEKAGEQAGVLWERGQKLFNKEEKK